ncbi:TatD family hydrolase [Pseudomonas petrae]|uniref:TatD family hydrolase n=1 Tax=Pseudomonas petrae TaxID=2912190 RepID=A0ABS9I504_9PSED|nr:TatD family hydrolase [Pseudomonas petrae]MCF7540111.1 TatD family hydrolase [Pseudomonas petrae]MCF7542076.1 TatD family hydrolase [Pseudomonas petrae]MCF7554643.1 TatD family hydrolase [Pseudomonas petrae]
MRLIDTHTHLDFDDFDADRDDVLANSRQLGVERIVVLGVYQRNLQRVWDLALSEPSVYAALGLHPVFLEEHQPEHVQQLRDWMTRLAGHPKLCAVGEIGLDYYIESLDRPQQQTLLDQQLQMAADFNLPALLHVRRSHADTIAALKRFKLKRCGIVHAFAGSREEAREYIKLGYKLGLGGAATWPQALRMHRVIADLPLESVVLETDSPDMAPAMFPGMRNSPEHLPDICAAVAELMKIPADTLAAASTANAREVFGWG